MSLSPVAQARLVLWAIIIGAAILGALLLATGGWRQLTRLLIYVGIKKREVELAKLDAARQAEEAAASADAAKIAELDAQQKALQKETAADSLRIDGMSHDEIVAELGRRGF